MAETMTLTVRQLDEVKPTQSGTPQRGVLTEQGWIKVRGASVAFLDVGTRIEVTEPTEFKGKKYSELKAVGVPADKPAAPRAPAPTAPPPAAGASAPLPAPRSATFYVAGAIRFDDYVRAVKNFYGLATALAPDVIAPVELPDGSKRQDVAVDRAQARAAMVNTFSIALTSGKIDMSEPAREPGSDDVPPWEKQAAAK